MFVSTEVAIGSNHVEVGVEKGRDECFALMCCRTVEVTVSVQFLQEYFGNDMWLHCMAAFSEIFSDVRFVTTYLFNEYQFLFITYFVVAFPVSATIHTCSNWHIEHRLCNYFFLYICHSVVLDTMREINAANTTSKCFIFDLATCF